MEEVIAKNGYEFSVVKSNSLKNWLLLQRAIFFAYGFSILSNIRSVYQFYNKNIHKIENEKDDFYRLIYFISRESLPVLMEYSYEGKIFAEFEDKVFDSLAVAKNGNIIAFAKRVLVFLRKIIKI